jgi:SAM-dependent methyltransferase
MPIGRLEKLLSKVPIVRRVSNRLDQIRAENDEMRRQFAESRSNDQLGALIDWLKAKGHPDLMEAQTFNQSTRDAWVRSRAETVPPASLVIDVGAGTSPYRRLFSHCDFETHDFAEYQAYMDGSEGAYAPLTYVSDITSIPVPDERYDVVLCTEVLEHVPKPIDAVKEMARIAKPGGRLFITAPLGSGLHQEPFHFYGGYTDHWYRKFLTDAGCEIVSIEPNHGYFAHLAQECARFSWTIDKHREHHGVVAEDLSVLMGDTLARYFYALDRKLFMREFTIGFHVEARRIS